MGFDHELQHKILIIQMNAAFMCILKSSSKILKYMRPRDANENKEIGINTVSRL